MSGKTENNDYRVDGTLVLEHNFAKIDVTGPYKNRELSISIISSAGQTIWQRSLKQGDFNP